MTKKPNLIIIPGIGDRGWQFVGFKPIWMLYGFNVYIHVFGWENQESYTTSTDKLLKLIDSLDKDVYIIGASAGGTSAINALYLRPNKIARIATISTPYRKFTNTNIQKLNQSVIKVQENLKNPSDLKRRILSVYGKTDKIVPPKETKTKGVNNHQINTNGHAISIFTALSFRSKIIKDFLLNGCQQ